MLNRQQIAKVLKQRDANHDTNFSVWVGSTSDTASQVFNDDGTIPYVRSQTAREERLLALDENYSQSRKYWKVSIVFDAFLNEPPSWLIKTSLGNYEIDSNQQWWISSDDGVSKQRCQVWSKETRGQQSHYWLYLMQ